MADTGDEDALSLAQAALKLRQDGEKEDLKAVAATYAGRAALWRVLDHCGIYRSTFSPDAGIAAFSEGKRAAGLWLLNEILTADGKLYTLMAQEAQDRAGGSV